MNNIVHIGLGKTATTSLQKYVFPQIQQLRPQITYNDPKVLRDIDLFKIGMLDSEALHKLKDKLLAKKNFISDEKLVNWNPRKWEASANENFELFGSDTTILITVRETEPYLRSVYQQMVHEGNIHSPENFFVSSQEYDAQERFLVPCLLQRFDVDSFDLRTLSKIYTDRFSKVLIVPLNAINHLVFLRDMFDLSAVEHENLCRIFKNRRRSNRAYSDVAMSLTFKRTCLLRYFGLELIGSDTTALERALILKKSSVLELSSKSLSLRQKLSKPIPRAAKKIRKGFLIWRPLMQNIVSRYLFRRPYSLPDATYINKGLAQSNNALIKELMDNKFKS